METLRLTGLEKKYRGTDEDGFSLRPVDLSIEEGELFTLLGPSGCGKTTLLKLVAGLPQPDGSRSFRFSSMTRSAGASFLPMRGKKRRSFRFSCIRCSRASMIPGVTLHAFTARARKNIYGISCFRPFYRLGL